jgi:hypothetical protein
MNASTADESRATLTLFATPKRFDGHIGVIQRNAIQSWTRMRPRPEIILFGHEPGTAETAAELGLLHIANVKCNQWGTPLISDLFGQAEKSGQGQVLSYVNSDIILLADFAHALTRVAEWSDHFLMVGRRIDLDIKDAIDFEADWVMEIRSRARQGKLQIARSIDYFAFSRGLYPSIPALAIGRFWWDNWLLWKARSLHAEVVDATRTVLAIHQNHDYSHTTYGPSKEEMMASEECILNARLTCEENPGDYEQGFFWRYAYTIDDATHRLTKAGIEKNPRRLWKQFKRYSSRPLGMAKLIRRRFAHSHPKTEKIVAESRR